MYLSIYSLYRRLCQTEPGKFLWLFFKTKLVSANNLTASYTHIACSSCGGGQFYTWKYEPSVIERSEKKRVDSSKLILKLFSSWHSVSKGCEGVFFWNISKKKNDSCPVLDNFLENDIRVSLSCILVEEDRVAKWLKCLILEVEFGVRILLRSGWKSLPVKLCLTGANITFAIVMHRELC